MNERVAAASNENDSVVSKENGVHGARAGLCAGLTHVRSNSAGVPLRRVDRDAADTTNQIGFRP